MIRLQPITETGVFQRHPQLMYIWNEEYTKMASEATDEYFPEGGIFLILLGRKVIGITGYYSISEDVFGLRWHGIIPKFRNQKLSKIVLDKLSEMLLNVSPSVKYLVEVSGSEKAASYFRHIGFIESTDADFNAMVLKESGDIGLNVVLTLNLQKS